MLLHTHDKYRGYNICLVCQFLVIIPKFASVSIKWVILRTVCVCLLLFAPDLCPEGSLWRSTHNLWDHEYAGPSGWSGWTALRGYVRSLKGLTSKWKLIGKMQLWSPAFPDDTRCSPPVCDRLLARGTRGLAPSSYCLEEGLAKHQMLIESGPIWQNMGERRHTDDLNKFI